MARDFPIYGCSQFLDHNVLFVCLMYGEYMVPCTRVILQSYKLSESPRLVVMFFGKCPLGWVGVVNGVVALYFFCNNSNINQFHHFGNVSHIRDELLTTCSTQDQWSPPEHK